MEATKPRLGRGLSALLKDPADGLDHDSGVRVILPLDRIERNPHQPRKLFDEDAIEHLTESIRNHGILQPLVVRPLGDQYQLIAGERRLRAATKVGLRVVPVHVVNFNDQEVFEAALAENIQRTDLNPLEKAQSFKEYMDRFNVTQEQLAHRLGMDRTSVTNLVNLLNLPPEVQDAVRLEQVSLGHAKVLKGVGDPARQVALCKEVLLKGLSVKNLEAIAKQKPASEQPEVELNPTQTEPTSPELEKTAHVQALEDEIRQMLAVKFEIKIKGKDRGQIIIGFESNDDFERVVDALRR